MGSLGRIRRARVPILRVKTSFRSGVNDATTRMAELTEAVKLKITQSANSVPTPFPAQPLPGTGAPGKGCAGLSGLGGGRDINRFWASDGEPLGRVLGQPMGSWLGWHVGRGVVHPLARPDRAGRTIAGAVRPRCMCLARWAAPTGATEEAPFPVSVTPSGLGRCLGGREPGLTPPAKVVSAFQAWGVDGESTGLGE
jgi:hypothetical protein